MHVVAELGPGHGLGLPSGNGIGRCRFKPGAACREMHEVGPEYEVTLLQETEHSIFGRSRYLHTASILNPKTAESIP